MSSSQTTRRQRAQPFPAFTSSSPIHSFLRRNSGPSSSSAHSEHVCLVEEANPRERLIPQSIVKTRAKPCQDPFSSFGSLKSPLAVLAPPPSPQQPTPSKYSRYAQPVPEAKPHEIAPRRRGRNAKRRARDAEHFRRYIHLRKQLKPWSDAFREKYGRTPSLIDVRQADIPGLVDRFVEYLEALDCMRGDS